MLNSVGNILLLTILNAQYGVTTVSMIVITVFEFQYVNPVIVSHFAGSLTNQQPLPFFHVALFPVFEWLYSAFYSEKTEIQGYPVSQSKEYANPQKCGQVKIRSIFLKKIV